MTITSPLELSVSNQGAFNVSRVSGRSALIAVIVEALYLPYNPTGIGDEATRNAWRAQRIARPA